MTATAEVFVLHRPRLFGIACRMLGSRSEAEDLLQDAYLRWHESRPANVQSAAGFLVTVTTRLCLDRLRRRKHHSAQSLEEECPPEAQAASYVRSPEAERECCEEVSAALATVFDRLERDERAAFLLHDVFDYDYPELARTLGKGEPACRQIVHRARRRLRESRPQSAQIAGSREQLMGGLLAAMKSGDRQAAMSFVTSDIDAEVALR